MSRRTKFLIIAIFLTLLGIVMAGTLYFWHADTPLRFTLVAEQKLPTPDESAAADGQPPYFVTVENASRVTVLFCGAVLTDRSHPVYPVDHTRSIIHPRRPFDAHAVADGTHWHWRMPPHSSVRCAVVPTQREGLAIAQRGGAIANYHWQTPLSYRWAKAVRSLYSHTPTRLRIWMFKNGIKTPGPFEDATPLEVPSASSVR